MQRRSANRKFESDWSENGITKTKGAEDRARHVVSQGAGSCSASAAVDSNGLQLPQQLCATADEVHAGFQQRMESLVISLMRQGDYGEAASMLFWAMELTEAFVVQSKERTLLNERVQFDAACEACSWTTDFFRKGLASEALEHVQGLFSVFAEKVLASASLDAAVLHLRSLCVMRINELLFAVCQELGVSACGYWSAFQRAFPHLREDRREARVALLSLRSYILHQAGVSRVGRESIRPRNAHYRKHSLTFILQWFQFFGSSCLCDSWWEGATEMWQHMYAAGGLHQSNAFSVLHSIAGQQWIKEDAKHAFLLTAFAYCCAREKSGAVVGAASEKCAYDALMPEWYGEGAMCFLLQQWHWEQGTQPDAVWLHPAQEGGNLTCRPSMQVLGVFVDRGMLPVVVSFAECCIRSFQDDARWQHGGAACNAIMHAAKALKHAGLATFALQCASHLAIAAFPASFVSSPPASSLISSTALMDFSAEQLWAAFFACVQVVWAYGEPEEVYGALLACNARIFAQTGEAVKTVQRIWLEQTAPLAFSPMLEKCVHAECGQRESEFVAQLSALPFSPQHMEGVKTSLVAGVRERLLQQQGVRLVREMKQELVASHLGIARLCKEEDGPVLERMLGEYYPELSSRGSCLREEELVLLGGRNAQNGTVNELSIGRGDEREGANGGAGLFVLNSAAQLKVLREAVLAQQGCVKNMLQEE